MKVEDSGDYGCSSNTSHCKADIKLPFEYLCIVMFADDHFHSKKQKHAHCENLHTLTEQEQNIGSP